MRPHYSLLALCALACSTDIGVVNKENVAPNVVIDSPADGETYIDGDTISFLATVADGDGIGTITSITWTSNIDGELGDPEEIALDSNGNSRLATALSQGAHTVTLSVTDDGGASATASIGLQITEADQLPEVEITSPTNNDIFNVGDPIDFVGLAFDPNQPADSLALNWTVENQSEGTVLLDLSDPASASGSTTARVVDAPEGTLRATLEVMDDDGNLATTDILVVVKDPDGDDNDGDAWSAAQGDCDDNDPNRFPGNPEICDGVDNDCNGIVDDKDDDGDNHVDELCIDYVGGLPLDDCDDNDDERYPGSLEVADGIDNDCNGLVDDGTPEWDQDGDCYCVGPNCSGSENPNCTTIEPGDCDDTDPNISPEDVDGDGYSLCDDDCDDNDPTLRPNDSDGDGFSSCAGDCDDSDATVSPADVDGDGYSTCQGDCDDRPLFCGVNCYPGNTSPDTCDSYDQDCDNMVDEDPSTTWYRDGDEDGYTSSNQEQVSCVDPDGPGAQWVSSPSGQADCDDADASANHNDNDGDQFSTCEGDCNDLVAGQNPGAAEVCDGIDNDCNTFVDDAPGTVWYEDGDLDGWTGTSTTSNCNDPDGAGIQWVGTPSSQVDCDDADASLNHDDADGDLFSTCEADCNDSSTAQNPGLAESCDGIDNDCDGIADNNLDNDGDGFTACDTIPDCDDNDASVYPGAPDDPDLLYADTNCDGIDGDRDAMIFMDPTNGSNSNNGSDENDAVRDLSTAYSRAASSGREWIAISTGTTDFTSGGVNFVEGVHLAGGYRANTGWSRAGSNLPIIEVASSGKLLSNWSDFTEWQQIHVQAENAGSNQSSIALRADNVTGLVLVDSIIAAGLGGDGSSGSTGSSGSSGSNGSAGPSGCVDSNFLCSSCANPTGGGGGGNGFCSNDGGTGGNPGHFDNGNAVNGSSGQNGGGNGGGGGGDNDDGGNGSSGSNGSQGSNGVGGGGLGAISGGTYSPADGTNGSTGNSGEGGGGGGGGGGGENTAGCNAWGGHGGGGGGGGCGGSGGTGGDGGGASIAILLAGNSLIDIIGTEIETADGGDGGAGGNGGNGGSGGGGGNGGEGVGGGLFSASGEGGDGGNGGQGGQGGHGGGGGGGPSIGIMCTGSAGVINDSSTFNIGGGGIGGNSQGDNGNTGATANTDGC